MNVRIARRGFSGIFRAPASKSHTIRRLILAALARGPSVIEEPLDSLDARSCLAFVRALGAQVTEKTAPGGEHLWLAAPPEAPFSAGPVPVDVGNSGTTLFLGLAASALFPGPFTFDGDAQIRRRSAGPLLDALSGLGVRVEAAPGGCAPITVQGPWKGGRVSLPCPTSQYLSALLLAAPLAPRGTVTEIDVPLLNEKPYIDMTLSYLKAQGVPFEAAGDFSFFRIPGGGHYEPVNGPVPGDFSSAAFPAAAGAVTGGPVRIRGLDPEDTQGDKVFFRFLEEMNCDVEWEKAGGAWTVKVARSGPLRGGTFDLNATPDLLPVMAVLGACAGGVTALVNAAHARIKETDRIAVMAEELKSLGVKTRERPDGLVIEGGAMPRGAGKALTLDGRGDHRIVMALGVLALGSSFPLEIAGAESAAVTYPGFLELIGGERINA